jgi:hypothetical protein
MIGGPAKILVYFIDWVLCNFHFEESTTEKSLDSNGLVHRSAATAAVVLRSDKKAS